MEEITNRKSVRSYSEYPVPDEVVAEILEAGRLVPSWMNVQPWKFIAVRDEATKEVLCRATGGQKHVRSAQVVIAAIADLSAWDRPNLAAILKKLRKGENVNVYLDNKTLNPTLISQFETMARTIEQVTYATAYMTLQAQKLGIGCCVVGAIANEMPQGETELIREVKECLNLGDRHILLTLLPLGYPKDATSPVKKIRKTADEVIFLEKLP